MSAPWRAISGCRLKHSTMFRAPHVRNPTSSCCGRQPPVSCGLKRDAEKLVITPRPSRGAVADAARTQQSGYSPYSAHDHRAIAAVCRRAMPGRALARLRQMISSCASRISRRRIALVRMRPRIVRNRACQSRHWLIAFPADRFCDILCVLLGVVFGAWTFMRLGGSCGVTDKPEPDERIEFQIGELPDYTIIVPLFRESRVVRPLIVGARCARLTRTKKLDIKLAVERDDLATRHANCNDSILIASLSSRRRAAARAAHQAEGA